jgi:hypothetical protein
VSGFGAALKRRRPRKSLLLRRSARGHAMPLRSTACGGGACVGRSSTKRFGVAQVARRRNAKRHSRAGAWAVGLAGQMPGARNMHGLVPGAGDGPAESARGCGPRRFLAMQPLVGGESGVPERSIASRLKTVTRHTLACTGSPTMQTGRDSAFRGGPRPGSLHPRSSARSRRSSNSGRPASRKRARPRVPQPRGETFVDSQQEVTATGRCGA